MITEIIIALVAAPYFIYIIGKIAGGVSENWDNIAIYGLIMLIVAVWIVRAL